MKIAEINMVDYGSTGSLMLLIANAAKKKGYEIRTYSMGWKNQKNIRESHTYFGTYLENVIHQVLSRVNGRGGCYSYFGTRSLLKCLSEFKPDIVHLHNLHNSYINLRVLFSYLKKNHIKTVWTLHDCWSFTGKCPHFVMSDCKKWKTGCFDCPVLNEYPTSKLDSSKQMWNYKKKCYAKFPELTIVTPSKWLSGLVKQSFLCDHPVHVINNGIDLSIFKPTDSNFLEKYNIQNKKIVLGVSFGWSNKKGLDSFVKLSKELGEEYKVILVGVDDDVKADLPDDIIAIKRTSDKKELSEIYSSADVFVNPTLEDTFPTVNIEALACGTPVVTYNTGGCAEIIDEKTGVAVEGYEELKGKIIASCTYDRYAKEDCVHRAEIFSYENCVNRYLELFNEVL